MVRLSQSFNSDEFYSHPEKSLKNHLENTAKIAKEYVSNIQIPSQFIKKEDFEDLIYIIGLYHDIGKGTKFFQEYLLETNQEKKAYLRNKPETRHSLISAIATFFAVEEYLKNKECNSLIKFFLPIFAFISVKRHHTNLISILEDIKIDSETIEILKKQINNLNRNYFSFLPFWEVVYKKLKNFDSLFRLGKLDFIKYLNNFKEKIILYIFYNLIYSILLDSDKHEAVIGKNIERKEIPVDLISNYRRIKNYHKSKNKINKIRNEIYTSVMNNLNLVKIDKDHIFSLTAPTGSGKTITSIGFALGLREKIKNNRRYTPRIIYSLPFLSIIDQNAKVIENVFEEVRGTLPETDLLLVHHHLSDITYQESNNEYEIDESEILIEGWDSEIIITTFVQLFHTLFTNSKRSIRKFHKILGSIIILDEIQSFPSSYWLLFKKTAEALANYFNTYFILSTATQPLIFESAKEIVSHKEKYFKTLNRNTLKIDIRHPKTLDGLSEYLADNLRKNPRSALIVLNTVNSSLEFYKKIKEKINNTEFQFYYLSSHIIPKERLRRINEIKESNKLKIVVSTQLIEAGVDIDLDFAIRDIGPLDSIYQIAGRVNRNFKKKKGIIEIVRLKDKEKNREFHSYIYDPVLIDSTIQIIKEKEILPEDKFNLNCSRYYEELRRRISNKESEKFLNAILNLNYEEIGKFKLIKEVVEQVDIFIEIDSEAEKIWKEYEKIQKIKDMFERRKEFLKIRKEFYEYVITLPITKAIKNLPPEVSGMRYVSKSQLSYFYDLETGFKTDPTVEIW